MRALEALLFAAATPLSEAELAERLPEGTPVAALLARMQSLYASRGVNLVAVAGGWALRTAPDLAPLLARERTGERKLSRAAMETLAIIAYHQPVTRAEIEEIRGVAVAKGTLDMLLEANFVRMRGRRRAPGRPVTFGTTAAFLDAFTLAAIDDLPGLDDLRTAGLLEGTPPAGFAVPSPRDDEALEADEDPFDGEPADGESPAQLAPDEQFGDPDDADPHP